MSTPAHINAILGGPRSKNLQAFLDMIAWSELGSGIIEESDRGYNVLAGSVSGMVLTFSSYKRHPAALLDMDGKPGGLQSTAAGRYQILGRMWRAYLVPLELKGFWPDDQDRIAIQMIKECKAVSDIEAGNVESAITKCRSRWASFAGAGYGQREHSIEKLAEVWRAALPA
jgi:muramidase (phage lysozyme)